MTARAEGLYKQKRAVQEATALTPIIRLLQQKRAASTCTAIRATPPDQKKSGSGPIQEETCGISFLGSSP